MKIPRGAGDADTAHPENMAQEFVGQVEAVGQSPIVRHEQPPHQPRLDAVKASVQAAELASCTIRT